MAITAIALVAAGTAIGTSVGLSGRSKKRAAAAQQRILKERRDARTAAAEKLGAQAAAAEVKGQGGSGALLTGAGGVSDPAITGKQTLLGAA